MFNSVTVIEKPSHVFPVVTPREGLPFCQFLSLVNSFSGVFHLYFSEISCDVDTTKAADSVFVRNSIKLQFSRSVLFADDDGFSYSALLLPVFFLQVICQCP